MPGAGRPAGRDHAGRDLAASGARRSGRPDHPGSGPTDRDGNNPGGSRQAPTDSWPRVWRRGHRLLRVDKRGMYGSRLAAADPNAVVTLGDYVDDVRAWIAEIHRRDAAAPVWLLAQRGRSGGAGGGRDRIRPRRLILVAVPGRPPRRRAAARATGRQPGQCRPHARGPRHPEPSGARRAGRGDEPGPAAAVPPGGAGVPDQPAPGRPGGHDSRDAQAGADSSGRARHPGRRGRCGGLHRANPESRLVLVAQANHVLKPVASDDRRRTSPPTGIPACPSPRGDRGDHRDGETDRRPLPEVQG